MPENFSEYDISKFNNNNFVMQFNNLPDVTFFLHSMPFPTINASVVNVNMPNFPIKYGMPSTTLDYGVIDCDILLDEKLTTWFSIYDWMIYNTKHANLNDYFTQATILVFTNAKNPMLRVDLVDCFPITLSSFQLQVESSEFQTFSATFQYRNIKYTRV